MQSENPSVGVRYLPEAFEAPFLELGRAVADDHAFCQTFERYVISVVADPAQLVHFRAAIINEAVRVAGAQPLITRVVWCALKHATDRYFADSARICSWNSGDKEQLVAKWYEFIALAFIPRDESTKLQTADIRAWSAQFLKLHTAAETGGAKHRGAPPA